mmetsp:Transcript_39818/g.63877  ORF Transcript_39818/g.63877 Transcript_39818/m.63877 type:complete len:209 (+) Transcript_39818:489-1115(+)
MSFSCSTTYSLPSVSYILSPAYLKYITLSSALMLMGFTTPSSPFFPGPTASTVAVQGFSMAPSVSMIPPAVIADASSDRSSTRSPMGVIWGMSAAVAPEEGKVPMRSPSLIMMYESPPISISVHPIPNLLYSTVLPFATSTQSAPNSNTSPEVGLRCADSARMMPPVVLVSAAAIFTSTRSAKGVTFLYSAGISNPAARTTAPRRGAA